MSGYQGGKLSLPGWGQLTAALSHVCLSHWVLGLTPSTHMDKPSISSSSILQIITQPGVKPAVSSLTGPMFLIHEPNSERGRLPCLFFLRHQGITFPQERQLAHAPASPPQLLDLPELKPFLNWRRSSVTDTPRHIHTKNGGLGCNSVGRVLSYHS